MKKLTIFLVMLLTITICFTGIASARELVLAGSTTVQKRILEPAQKAIEEATGISVKVLGINSGKGFEDLREGKITASISSSPLKSLLEKAGIPDDGTYQEHVIMQDVIVPIVHKDNPITELTWQQLADINTGKITNWKDVGGPAQKTIVGTSQPTAATRIVFQEEVMNKAPYVKDVREVMSTRQEIDLVSSFKGGIGAVSEGFVAMNQGKVKIIKTSKISRPLSFLTKGKPSADVQAVIDFLKTPAAKKLFN